MSFTQVEAQAVRCSRCGAQVPENVLVCPACHALRHAERLKQLAATADAATQAEELTAAITAWREAQQLLPPESQQYQSVSQRIDELSRRIDRGEGKKASGRFQAPPPPPPASPSAASTSQGNVGTAKKSGLLAGAAIIIGLLLKFKALPIFLLSKMKFVLVGLSKSFGTLATMAASLALYWSLWGWKFAAGLVISIYIHEMGHVYALRRFGIPASAPMFIPGLGAFIRLKHYPTDPVGDARTGLAGPLWGLGAAVGAYLVHLATGWASLAAIAKVGAWINMFNLLPIYPLDGGHGFRALVRWQRGVVAAAMLTCWAAGPFLGLPGQGLLLLVAIVAGIATFTGRLPDRPDHRTLFQFLFLVAALSVCMWIPVPTEAR